MPIANVLSAVPGIVWPGVPGPNGAMMLSMQFQLERSQWFSVKELIARQAMVQGL